MSNQTLKFEFSGSHFKSYYRYPDRKTATLSAEQRQQFAKDKERADNLKEVVTELIKSVGTISLEDLEIKVKTIEKPVAKGTGPISAEFHLVEEIGVDDQGKSVFKEFGKGSKVKFHTSSVRNSYEKARQYAMHNWFKDNKIIFGDPIYNAIIASYESRGENVAKFCHDRDEIEKLIS